MNAKAQGAQRKRRVTRAWLRRWAEELATASCSAAAMTSGAAEATAAAEGEGGRLRAGLFWTSRRGTDHEYGR
jgi:hypothetical protein